jgi:hypothetical protein
MYEQVHRHSGTGWRHMLMMAVRLILGLQMITMFDLPKHPSDALLLEKPAEM